MDEKIERLIGWNRGKVASPFSLDINPTDKCNFRCIHCWQRAFKEIDSSYEISDEKLIELVRDGIKFGVMEFEITGGGEPLIRKELTLKAMEMIKRKRKFGNITTNSSLFDLKDVKKIVGIGWDRITFSLDGPDAKVNDSIRGKGTFEQVMKSIKLFNRIKEETKMKLPILKFNVVVNKKNYNSIDGMIELASKVNCSIIHFDSITIHSESGRKLKLNEKEEKEFEEHAKISKKMAEKFGISTDINFLTSELLKKSNQMRDMLKKESDSEDFSSLVCYEPWWHLVIKTSGTAQPCCLFDEKEENVKNKGLKEIWFGDFFENIREDIKNKEFSRYCSICNVGQVVENRRIREELKLWMKR